MPFALSGRQVDLLLRYVGELQKWNRVHNLTAIRDARDIVTRHLLDSLALVPLLSASPACRLVDVGSGAGLPAVPLAIAQPALHVAALDGNGKKARFLRHVQRTLGLDNLQVIEARAEAFHPEVGFDVVTSRAFGSIADFLRLTRHLLAPGGQWVAMKGKLDARELAGIPDDVRIRENRRLHVPGLNEERHAVVAAMKQVAA